MIEAQLNGDHWQTTAASGEYLHLARRTPSLWQVTGAALTARFGMGRGAAPIWAGTRRRNSV